MPLKLLLCVSKTPDTTSKITFTPDGKSLDTSAVQFILNPYDDHALARAMEIKEKSQAHLTVVHVGDGGGEAILRRCLAIGVDEAIRIDTSPKSGLQVAQLVSQALKSEGFDLIITGRESIDFNGSEVCDALGEYLDIPSISFVTSLDVDGTSARVSRFIDGGEETLTVPLPIVISATKELAEPRIPNMRGIMASRTKPIRLISSDNTNSLVELESLQSPEKKKGCIFIDASEAGKLIDLLHTQDKVI